MPTSVNQVFIAGPNGKGMSKMIRKAFMMEVYPGAETEYEKRHNPIWPELESVLKSHGVQNYSIFLNQQTNQLFAYTEIEDESRWEAIARTGECRDWWKRMRDLMPTQPDNSPCSVELKEVFHLE